MTNPNYYAILTAEVRYSTKINANEKLLFAEITALSNSTGECWASNNYFATLYDVSPQAVSKWINNLSKVGFINLDYIYKSGSKEIEKRIIKGINRGLYVSTYDSEVSTKDCGGYQHTIKDNNTSINNKLYNNINNTLTEVINHFNLKTNKTKYQKGSERATLEKYINAMIKNGDTLEAIKNLIDYKLANPNTQKIDLLSWLNTQYVGQNIAAAEEWNIQGRQKITKFNNGKPENKLHRANSQDYGDEVF